MTISHVSRLAPEQLRRRVDSSTFVFGTTDELEPLGGLLAQRRAEAAIHFGTRIDKDGFNLFVIGRTGRLANEAVVATLKTAAGERNPPSGWVYGNNFEGPHKPSAIPLPAGRAPRFSIYPIASIDEGIALLTGCPAGTRDVGKAYPSGSVYRRVEDRLQEFAEIRRNFAVTGSSSNSR